MDEKLEVLTNMVAHRWCIDPKVAEKVISHLEGTPRQKMDKIRKMGVNEFSLLCLKATKER
jgi:hypothetical protein